MALQDLEEALSVERCAPRETLQNYVVRLAPSDIRELKQIAAAKKRMPTQVARVAIRYAIRRFRQRSEM